METLVYTHHCADRRREFDRTGDRQFAATLAGIDRDRLSAAGWTGALGLALAMSSWGSLATVAAAQDSFNETSFTEGTAADAASPAGSNDTASVRPRVAPKSDEKPGSLVDAIDAVTFGIWKNEPAPPVDAPTAVESDAPAAGAADSTASGGGGPIPPQYRTTTPRSSQGKVSSSGSYGGGTLRYGNRSAAVIRLQSRLRELGFFSGRSTGYFGSATLSAVKAFQRSQGLAADGVVGSSTRSALYGGGAPASTGGGYADASTLTNPCRPRIYSNSGARGTVPEGYSKEGSGGGGYGPSYASTACSSCDGSIRQKVSLVQTRLKELGHFHFRVTGYYGPITRNAVISFQRSRGLRPDGVAGPETKAALGLSF